MAYSLPELGETQQQTLETVIKDLKRKEQLSNRAAGKVHEYLELFPRALDALALKELTTEQETALEQIGADLEAKAIGKGPAGQVMDYLRHTPEALDALSEERNKLVAGAAESDRIIENANHMLRDSSGLNPGPWIETLKSHTQTREKIAANLRLA